MDFSSTDLSEAEGERHHMASAANTDLCPPLNEEIKQILRQSSCNPLVKQDEQWTPDELSLLREAVKNSVIEAGIKEFVERQEILHSSILRAGVETSTEQVQRWKKEIEVLDRKIQESSAELVDLLEWDLAEYSCVDWLKISTIDFEGIRSAAALQCKWLNEHSPQWNSGPWTEQKTSASWTKTNDWWDEADEWTVSGMNVSERGRWEEFLGILPRHEPKSIRMRDRRLLSTKLKLSFEKRCRFACKTSSTAVAAYKSGRHVMRQKLTFGRIQGRCFRATKQQAEKNENAMRSNEITKKFRNGLQPQCVTDVAEDIDLTVVALNRLTISAEKPKRSCHHTAQAQENLMRAKTNEEKLLYEEYELGDVGNEVKITSTEQCGSIDSEDSADDALTKTIKTVKDRVCCRSSQKKKRGKSSEKNRQFGILATSEKKANARKRRIFPRGLTRRMRLALPDGSSSRDDNLNLDSNSSADTSISTSSQQRQDSLGDAEISANKVVSLTAVTEVQQAANAKAVHVIFSKLRRCTSIARVLIFRIANVEDQKQQWWWKVIRKRRSFNCSRRHYK